MLKLLKLAAVAAMVFVVYEIFTTLTRSEATMGSVREAFTPSSGTGPVLSGATHEGTVTSVRNSDGGEHRQVIGRGVVRH